MCPESPLACAPSLSPRQETQWLLTLLWQSAWCDNLITTSADNGPLSGAGCLTLQAPGLDPFILLNYMAHSPSCWNDILHICRIFLHCTCGGESRVFTIRNAVCEGGSCCHCRVKSGRELWSCWRLRLDLQREIMLVQSACWIPALRSRGEGGRQAQESQAAFPGSWVKGLMCGKYCGDEPDPGIFSTGGPGYILQ